MLTDLTKVVDMVNIIAAEHQRVSIVSIAFFKLKLKC